MNVLIINGHLRSGSLSDSFEQAYADGAGTTPRPTQCADCGYAPFLSPRT